jgi:hypothetical protein
MHSWTLPCAGEFLQDLCAIPNDTSSDHQNLALACQHHLQSLTPYLYNNNCIVSSSISSTIKTIFRHNPVTSINHITYNGQCASEVDITTINHVRSHGNKRDCQVNSMRLYLCVYNYANQAQSRSDSRRFLCPHFYLFLYEDGQMSHKPDPSTTQGVLV